VSKPPIQKFALRTGTPFPDADRHEEAPRYMVELTRFGARIRMARSSSDGHPGVSRIPEPQPT
jgi:hypothetical protein